jgi:hypothetical protein
MPRQDCRSLDGLTYPNEWQACAHEWSDVIKYWNTWKYKELNFSRKKGEEKEEDDREELAGIISSPLKTLIQDQTQKQ